MVKYKLIKNSLCCFLACFFLNFASCFVLFFKLLLQTCLLLLTGSSGAVCPRCASLIHIALLSEILVIWSGNGDVAGNL